jgi:flagellar assembly protein FliH
MSDAFSGFTAGFVSRHDAAAAALVSAFPVAGFEARAVGPAAATGAGSVPRHFSPADPAANPTAGWDPLDPSVGETRIDPLAAAHAAGYEEGLAAAAVAAAAVRAEGERDQTMVARLLGELAAAGRIDRDAVARRLRDTVLALTAKLVGEVGVSPDLLAARIEAATDLLADKAESALLRVHPDDVGLLDGKLPATLFAAGDAAVERGSFVLESASTVVEDGPALWLDQLAETIDRLPLPAKAPSC